MKAVVLAAGEGRRLKPITNLRPKPMIPVANRPLLEYVVDAVSEAGIDELVLVVGYKRNRIQNHFGTGDDWNVDIQYAVQDTQLGTGHAIAQAEEFIDEDFLVLNGDRIIEANLVEQIAEKHGEVGGAVMAVTRSEEPNEYGVVELSGNRVSAITEKPPWYSTTSELINAGVYGFEPSIFDEIRDTEPEAHGELTITATLARLAERETVRCVRSTGMWIDVSHLWDILSVNAGVLDRSGGEVAAGTKLDSGSEVGDAVRRGSDCRVGPNATVHRGTAIGNNVTIGANAVISNSVIMADCVIGEGVVIKDCVIGENTHVGPGTTVVGGTADVVVEKHFYDGVKLGGIVGDNSRVGGGVLVTGGAIIGDGTRIANGAVLEDRVPSNAEVLR